MEWTYKYNSDPDFLALFETEQDYVDAMFMLIVVFNYGKVVKTSKPRKIRFE
jgi:hypothetical protein